MSHKFLLIVALIGLALVACNPAAALAPFIEQGSPTSVAPTETPPAVLVPTVASTLIPAPTKTSTALPPSVDGAAVSYGLLRFLLPTGVATGISGSQFARAEGNNVAPWDVTPGHAQVKLEGYLLQGKFHEPKILVYPAQPYGEQSRGAFESIRRLNNILGNPGASINIEQLPTVPFFNAAQVFASNVKVLSFQNGKGVRFLTEYAQYPASVNNHDLFYHFEGVTSDGAYYVIAILPITVPVLAETPDGGAIVPRGGIAYPDITNPNVNWKSYYAAVTNLLNAQSPAAFAPTINRLDSLIQSIQISR